MNSFRRVLGCIGVCREHCGDWFTNMAYAPAREHRLAIRLQRLCGWIAEIHRRHVRDIITGPDRNHAWNRQGFRCVNLYDFDREQWANAPNAYAAGTARTCRRRSDLIRSQGQCPQAGQLDCPITISVSMSASPSPNLLASDRDACATDSTCNGRGNVFISAHAGSDAMRRASRTLVAMRAC